MASENAKQVAKKVSETIRKGKKVVLGKIIKDVGYAKSTSEHPDLITNTKSYQKGIKPVIQQIEKEIQRLQIAISKKKLSKVAYSEAVRSLDLLIKNKQLLSGKETERHGFSLTDLLKEKDGE